MVEDDIGVRHVAQGILTRLGYTVLTAANADEAFRVVDAFRGHVDLLMTDVVMPGMNGRELAERLTERHPKMRVLYTSGYTENVVVHHGVVEKDLYFISKPYAVSTLAAKIRDVLGPGM